MSADFQKMPDAELVALAEKCGAQQCGMEGEFLGFSSVEQLRTFAQEAARQAMERCAEVCDVTPPYPFRPSIEAAHAIRSLIPQDPDHLAGVGKMVDGKDQSEERHG